MQHGEQPPKDLRAEAENAFTASQRRGEVIKQEIAREREKVDAKTAKLRALRLAKEAADRAAGVAPVKAIAKRVRPKKS